MNNQLQPINISEVLPVKSQVTGMANMIVAAVDAGNIPATDLLIKLKFLSEVFDEVRSTLEETVRDIVTKENGKTMTRPILIALSVINEEGRRQFEVNVFGPARLVQLVTPHMREQGSGRIINISSVGGKFYEPLGAWYHATKFAVEGFSDSLRLELAPYGIRVVIVEPGPIRTEWNTIARDGLVASSAGTAYESQAEGVRARMESGEGPMLSSGPDVVAKKILRAATARRPRSRYPVGRGAGSIVTARRLLPDRALDAVIGRLYS